MNTVLTDIVAQRQHRLRELAELYPAEFLQQAIRQQPQRPERSLAAQLRRADKGFILECKKASPSKGLIRESFDPVAIAKIYQPYAAAISVLTEPDFFHGSFAYLQAVSQQVQVPVLCKDFIIEPLQLYLARYFGADAVLLMLSLLDNETYTELAALADSLGLEILTEVSNAEEMQRAGQLNASIIGINHRNLHDLSVDSNRTAELAPLAPAGALLIAESGLTSHEQVRTLGPHVDGFLVGSHLTAQADIDQACRSLIYGNHKVCGLTREEDAIAACASGAVYAGVIFAPHSPRCITTQKAQAIMQAVPALKYVAVLTTDDVDEVISLIDRIPLHAVQLHGQQPRDFVETLASRISGRCELWYALSMTGETELPELPVSRFVLDNGQGGSGMSFDWSILRKKSLHNELSRCLLAGGLSAENVDQAARLKVAGLDINSGAEQSPGIKDAARLSLIFNRLASYFRPSTTEDKTL